jgi:Cys-tRNA(Pro)/Cys-tRNA(Cys) deacylase
MSPEVRRLLVSAGVDFTVHEHEPLVSYEEAKGALPFDPAAMVKGLVFRAPDGRYAIVALRAAHRADYKRIAGALGIRRAELRMATADEIGADLDMQAGGVVPVPVNGALVLLDRAVLDLDVIICGSGRNDATLEIAGPDLVRVAAGTVGEFARAT